MSRFNGFSRTPMWLTALLLAALVAGCGGGGGSGGGAAGATVLPGAAGSPGASATDPTVISSTPANLATNVPTSTDTGAGVTGRQVTATFSQPMDPVTLNSNPAGTLATFTLKETVAGTNVPGTVAMNGANTVATFTPTAAALLPNTNYTATVTTAAKNLALGTAMAKAVAWTFTTNAVALTGQAPVNLGTAGNFAILAKTGISTTGVTAVTGNIGVSPNAASFITGFTLAAPPTSSTTAIEVVGLVFAADYDPPTPINLGVSVSNMETAFTDAAGRAAGVGPRASRCRRSWPPSFSMPLRNAVRRFASAKRHIAWPTPTRRTPTTAGRAELQHVPGSLARTHSQHRHHGPYRCR